MSKLTKLNTMYEYAMAQCLCRNKKTFAELVGKTQANLSTAFHSENNEQLTDSFLLKVNKALGSPYNVAWLLYDQEPMMKSDTQSGDTIIGDGNATRGAQINYTKKIEDSYARMEIELEYARARIKELQQEKQELLDRIQQIAMAKQ